MRATVLCATLLCAACGGADAVSVPPPPPPIPPYSTPLVEIRYPAANIAPDVRAVVEAAADKWSRALSKDRGQFHLQASENECFAGEPKVDEQQSKLLLFVTSLRIDDQHGVLASTSVCDLSSVDRLPLLAQLKIDRDDIASMEQRGILAGVIMHEMGHALGFNPKTYMPLELTNNSSDDPVFTGESARTEFANHNTWYAGTPVPLENTPGLAPRDPHWRFSVFGDELMSPAIGQGFKSPLSAITLGYFKDIGYDVDFSVADPYEVAPLPAMSAILPATMLVNDLRIAPELRLVSPVER